MSEPKLLTILKAVSSRLSGIDGAGQYYTNVGKEVVRGKRQFREDELPACVCYLAPRTPGDEQGDRQKVEAQVVIEAHHAIEDHPEDTAVQMLADIQRAVELSDVTLGGLVLKRLAFAGDAVFYPEESGNYVSVQVIYEINHIRAYGEPNY